MNVMVKQHKEHVLSQRGNRSGHHPWLFSLIGYVQESWGWLPRVNWYLTQFVGEESCRKMPNDCSHL